MRLLLSGEGKTDLGQVQPGPSGLTYWPGPMAWIIDRLVEDRLDYSLLESHAAGSESVRFVDEAELADCGKSGPRLLPGIRYGKGQAFFTRNAQVLGLLAMDEQRASAQPVIAVLFRDADRTAATPRDQWQAKVDSIARGFELVEFRAGVPMVPRPKSEAWLLCGLKPQPCAQCDDLEDAPGNDGSPQALKTRLRALIGQDTGAEEQADWIRSGRIDPRQIQMPSFKVFREALSRALDVAALPLT